MKPVDSEGDWNEVHLKPGALGSARAGTPRPTLPLSPLSSDVTPIDVGRIYRARRWIDEVTAFDLDD